jgi:hypothetical protein
VKSEKMIRRRVSEGADSVVEVHDGQFLNGRKYERETLRFLLI